ncbi:MAG: DUF21 domain-containing protein [Mollicutes bacterium]|nr:DUF21 domain-containing protein [Mollicutes bacterium]
MNIKDKVLKDRIIKKDKAIRKVIDIKWIFFVTVLAFILTLILSGTSNKLLEDINLWIGLFIIIFFIFIGVFFDMIGIAVTSADEKPFHSMAAKKVRSAKSAIRLLKNSEKVSAFLNDVIGDICNIMSGSAGIVVSSVIAVKFKSDLVLTTLIVTSSIAALTIGGKALGKSFAVNKSELIVYEFAKILSIFKR